MECFTLGSAVEKSFIKWCTLAKPSPTHEQGVKRTAILSYLRLGVLLHGRTVVSGKSRYVTGLEVGARSTNRIIVLASRDDPKLDVGEEIVPNLFRAIELSWFLDGDADLPEILRPLAAFDWGAGRRGI
ncbi:hypothetical protein V6N13_013934 [Hibiscus sabdariffa]